MISVTFTVELAFSIQNSCGRIIHDAILIFVVLCNARLLFEKRPRVRYVTLSDVISVTLCCIFPGEIMSFGVSPVNY